jgi:lambda repressor-like predicted transcriptional regulator
MYDRIEILLKKNNLSKRQLAIKAGIPYPTLLSAFKRRSEGL